ncbi:hypothetical protein SteCoe_10150 [Stentor coeruleus]|uniref:Uncharacterized protein n=1 Tax=Stentor coeruleus TaxID=5963 RepID=A0A1R2CG50_9CILI|nr:hypothetical protein SteCoe_10150 [Stentor coeruleus]
MSTIEVIIPDLLKRINQEKQSNIINILTLSPQINLKEHQIILMTSEGRILSKCLPVSEQISSSEKLIVFNKSEIKIDCSVPRKSIDSSNNLSFEINYQEPFDFSSIKIPFERIPSIDENLFNNSERAWQMSAVYKLSMKRLTKVKKMIEIRFSAAKALLKNLELYSKSLFGEIKNLSNQSSVLLESIKVSYNAFELCYRGFLAILPESLKSELDSSDYSNFGHNIDGKISSTNMKILKNKEIFNDIDKFISKSIEDMKTTYGDNIVSLDNLYCNSLSFEELFGECHTIVLNYEIFRSYLDDILNRRISNSEILDVIEKYESIYKNDILALEKIDEKLTDVNEQDEILDEICQKVQGVYKQIVSNCVKYVNKLKYDLPKLKKKIESLKSLKKFLEVPARYKEILQDAETESCRSNKEMEKINNYYINMCKWRIKESIMKDTFINKYGKILPKQMYQEICKPEASRMNVRSALNLYEGNQKSEQELNSMSEENLIMYYEGRLATIDEENRRNYEAKKDEEKNLIEHYEYLNEYKEKIENDNFRLAEKIYELSNELNISSNSAGSEACKFYRKNVKIIKKAEDDEKIMFEQELNEALKKQTGLMRILDN